MVVRRVFDFCYLASYLALPLSEHTRALLFSGARSLQLSPTPTVSPSPSARRGTARGQMRIGSRGELLRSPGSAGKSGSFPTLVRKTRGHDKGRSITANPRPRKHTVLVAMQCLLIAVDLWVLLLINMYGTIIAIAS